MEQSKEAMQRNIMRQLLNPNISLDTCKRVVETLSTKTVNQLQQLLAQLKKNHATYLEQVKLTTDSDELHDLCEQMKERIGQCKDWFEVQLKDILQFTYGSHINLLEVAWDLVTPASLTDVVNDYVRGQQRYVSAMSLLLYNFSLCEKNDGLSLPKSNLLVYGPTGVGKTYCPQVLSRILGIELEIVNCNMIVQEGIVGLTLTDALTRAYLRNPNFKRIIIVLDEYDKVFFKSGHYNERIQHEIQSFTDDNNIITFRDSFAPYASQRQISTKNITVVFTGVFSNLKTIVERRMNFHNIGFATQALAEGDKNEFYNFITREDFVSYMHSDELAGRIGQTVLANSMSDDLLLDILLNAAESPLGQFKNYFALHGIHLNLTDEAAQAIVSHVQELQLGVRGLKSVLWQVLQQPMQSVDKRVPATQQLFNELNIDRSQVEQLLFRTTN